MKKELLICAAVFLLCAICVITALAAPVGNTDDDFQAMEPPLFFDSFAEFEAHERTEKRSSNGCYYIPSNLTDDFTLQQISMREDVYIAVTYSVDSSGFATEDMSSYARERRTTLICQKYLFEDGTVSLNGVFIPNGYKPVEYQGRTVYRYDDYDTVDSNLLVGYDIVFLEDGYLIYMHLPPLDTFENMMKYSNVIKVNIG